MTQPASTDPSAGPAPTPPPTPSPSPTPAGPVPTPPPSPTPTPSGPPAVPQFVAPPPTPPATGQVPTGTDPATGSGPDGFPANTPVAQMNPEQQVAYWKYQSRKHEERVKAMADYEQYKAAYDEYQRLLTASQTEQERAVAEARRQGHAEALSAAGGQLVEQWVRAAAAGRLAEQSVDALLAGLDRTRFLRTDGGVDTDKVYQFVGSIAPAPTVAVTVGSPGAVAQPAVVPPPPAPVVTPAGGPDFGQGHPSNARPSGIEAGRALARQRFAAQSTTTAPARS